MWRLVFFLAGWCRIRITGASPQWILSALATRRIAFREFRKTDDFTAELRILKRDLPAAYAAAQRSMCDLELMQCGGFAATFAWVKKRPLFPLLLALAILMGTSLPRFVWFYEGTGNERVPAQKILRELDALGVERVQLCAFARAEIDLDELEVVGVIRIALAGVGVNEAVRPAFDAGGKIEVIAADAVRGDVVHVHRQVDVLCGIGVL